MRPSHHAVAFVVDAIRPVVPYPQSAAETGSVPGTDGLFLSPHIPLVRTQHDEWSPGTFIGSHTVPAHIFWVRDVEMLTTLATETKSTPQFRSSTLDVPVPGPSASSQVARFTQQAALSAGLLRASQRAPTHVLSTDITLNRASRPQPSSETVSLPGPCTPSASPHVAMGTQHPARSDSTE